MTTRLIIKIIIIIKIIVLLTTWQNVTSVELSICMSQLKRILCISLGIKNLKQIYGMLELATLTTVQGDNLTQFPRLKTSTSHSSLTV